MISQYIIKILNLTLKNCLIEKTNVISYTDGPDLQARFSLDVF